MSSMSRLLDLASIAPFEAGADGVRIRRIEGERITVGVFELAPGAVVAEHRHEAEQIGMCIRGQLTFTLGEETRTLGPGGTWCIPSGVPHSAVAGPDGAIAVDAFSPIRADWDFPLLELQPPIWPDEG
jgi:quercetin dioxygenase-like cupin family protein